MVAVVGETLRLWRVADGVLVQNVSLPAYGSAVAISPDGKVLAVAAHTTIRLLELASFREIRVLEYPWTLNVQQIVWSLDSSLVLTMQDSGVATVWNAINGRKISDLLFGNVDQVMVAPDFRAVFTASGHELTRWNLDNMQREWNITIPAIYWINALAWDSDQQHLHALSRDHLISIRATNGQIDDMRSLVFDASDGAIAPGGIWWATGNWEGTVAIWRGAPPSTKLPEGPVGN